MTDYKNTLTRAGISSGDVSIIVHNLDKLEAAGFRGNLDDIVTKVIKDSSFKSAFIRDYKVAMR
ncbi:MAG: hypothetical protein ACTSYJ_06140 [Candidatus Thorarchaeota archaeon]